MENQVERSNVLHVKVLLVCESEVLTYKLGKLQEGLDKLKEQGKNVKIDEFVLNLR